MPDDRRLICALAAWLCACALTGQPAIAQTQTNERKMEWASLPSHRYLPPPQGARSVLDQVKLLEKFNDLVGQNPEKSPLELSPQQLKMLNNLVESFRNDKGELELPDPKSIPPQWIDNLVPDPKQREQVKRMLEQYSRDQQLPFKNSPKDLPTPQREKTNGAEQDAGSKPDEASPFQRRDAAARQPSETDRQQPPANQSLGNPFSGRPSNRQSNNPPDDQTGNQSRQSSASDSLPDGIPEEYRALFNKLKQFEQQNRKSLEAQAPWQSGQEKKIESVRNNRTDVPPRSSGAPGVTDARRPNQANRSSPSSVKARRNPSATPQNSSAGEQSTKANNAASSNNPNFGNSGLRPRDSGIDANPLDIPNPNYPASGAAFSSDTSDLSKNGNAANQSGSAGGQAPSSNTTPDSNTASSPSELLQLDSRDNPFSSEYRAPQMPQPEGNQALTPAMDATSLEGTGGGSSRQSASSRSSRGFNVTRLSEQSGNNRTEMRRSIEESGLAKSLKKIVEDTIKEQEAERARRAQRQGTAAAANGQVTTSSMDTLKDLVRSSQNSADNAVRPANAPSANAQATSGPGPNNRPSAGSSSWSNSSSKSSEQWTRWANDLWKSISVIPEDAPRRTGSSSSSSAGGATSLGMPEFRWTSSMTTVLLLAASLIATVIWLSRRRLVEMATASQRQAEWIKSVLSDGLKTRADVIRAFHTLVRRTRPVADWWTHRLVVRHFNQHTPQYAAAMSELANVYEQARYYPEDADLTPQQLEQVRRIVESLSQSKM